MKKVVNNIRYKAISLQKEENYDRYLLESSKTLDIVELNTIDIPIEINGGCGKTELTNKYNLKKIYMELNTNIIEWYNQDYIIEISIDIGSCQLHRMKLQAVLFINSIYDEPLIDTKNLSKLLLFTYENKYGIQLNKEQIKISWCNYFGVDINLMSHNVINIDNENHFEYIDNIYNKLEEKYFDMFTDIIVTYQSDEDKYENTIHNINYMSANTRFMIFKFSSNVELTDFDLLDLDGISILKPKIIEFYLYDIKHYLISFIDDIESYEDLKLMYQYNNFPYNPKMFTNDNIPRKFTFKYNIFGIQTKSFFTYTLCNIIELSKSGHYHARNWSTKYYSLDLESNY
jgi:hypothetical protein